MNEGSIILQPLKCAPALYYVSFVYNLTLALQYADKAQQAFSASATPTLFNVLPAIEALHASWMKAMGREKYEPFHVALDAAMTKLDEYYTKTAASDAHIIAMGM